MSNTFDTFSTHGLSRRQLLWLLASSGVHPAAVATDAVPQRTFKHWFAEVPSNLAIGPARASNIRTEAPDSTAELRARATRLVRWARQVMKLVTKYQQNPLRAARALAYVQVAMHDAWHHSEALPPHAWTDASELAAHRAASLVMEHLYANETPGQFEAQFEAINHTFSLDDTHRHIAMAIGKHVAGKLIERSLRDGAGRVWPLRGRPATFEGMWQPSYPLYAVNPVEGFAPQWLPWITRNAKRYTPPPPPRPGSQQHTQETRQVHEVTRALTSRQKQVAQLWNLDAGSVTPGGVWIQHTIEVLLSTIDHRPDMEAQECMGLMLPVLASVSVALHDAFVECWRVKLQHWSERPVTAVRRDIDPAFVPLLVTPGFPSYVSGHATASSAAATVLSSFFPAHRSRFEAMAREAAVSRLWGGIHFQCDNEEGLLLGRAVGDEVIARGAPSA